ncbi:MAG: AraC family transcriptional regulator [Acaryochloridaceae cyanobacterium RL_2_7]|nr:AraC family transcriptional regulator [Acaryochloridaceae cyanobacterium RL_2_7]
MPLANVKWSPAVNSHFEVLRLQNFKRRELPDDHDPSQAHRLHFHALILVTGGQGTHGVDFVDYPVKAGTLIHICANQIHYFGQNQELEGYIVVFLPAALPTNLLGLSTSIASPLSWSTIQHIWPSVASLNLETAQFLQQHMELLEAHQIMGAKMQPATQYLLWSMIALAAQVAVESDNPHGRRAVDPRFLEFIELLEQSFESCRNMKWYAEQMSCSARTLYRICMTAVGKSPKVITDERVAIEAQRRLLFDQTTVKEVGQTLGFDETTNFIKFFKRLVGQNPDQFRTKSNP